MSKKTQLCEIHGCRCVAVHGIKVVPQGVFAAFQAQKVAIWLCERHRPKHRAQLARWKQP